MDAVVQAAIVLVLLALVPVPLGDYLARAYTSDRHWRLERAIFRIGGVDADADQRWPVYLRSLLTFSVSGIALLYVLLRAQAHLPYALGHPGMPPALAFNTAVSLTTNTSWQSYAGESTLGHTALAVGLGVQGFLSVAVGIAAAVALVRGLARRERDRVGNFWVDVTRSCTRVVLPLSLAGGVVLLELGVVQNWHGSLSLTTVTGAGQTLLGGPMASWEPVKLLTGDGGGAFNVNSAHPFENPSPHEPHRTVHDVADPVGVSARVRADGRRPTAGLGTCGGCRPPARYGRGRGSGRAGRPSWHGADRVGGSMEGTETRNGIAASALFGVAATASADGAANSSYDSFTALGGGVLMANMMLGEVSPGGGGSGLSGLLIAVMIAVFLGGLMIGRTPEYLGKRVRRREMTFVALYTLALPLPLLGGTAIAIAFRQGRSSLLNSGPHGLSEALYAFTSAANSNGSAFAGINANTTFYNTLLGVVMLLGRYLPMVFVVALAGAFARQRLRPATEGTLPTHTPFLSPWSSARSCC